MKKEKDNSNEAVATDEFFTALAQSVEEEILQEKNTIVTPTEKKFKEYLQQHLPQSIEIHCKVRFLDVLHRAVERKLAPHFL